MPAFNIIPQHLVDLIGPALSQNQNTGQILAEQLLRTENGGTLVQKMMSGETLSPGELVQLPPLVAGNSWDSIAKRIKSGVTTLPEALARIDQLELQAAPSSELPPQQVS